MQEQLHTVAIEPKYNSSYTQWLDSPDTTALTKVSYRYLPRKPQPVFFTL